MQNWQEILRNSISDPDILADRLSLDRNEIRQITRVYPLRVTDYYLSLVKYPGDPIFRQFVPDLRELQDDQSPDPLDEERLSPVPGLIHRYPDRVVWLVSGACAVYCRFCMRKRHFGCSSAPSLDVDAAISYISSDRRIRDVILSGGDPFLLNDEQLDFLLARIREIPHVEIIRIGTRLPVTLPQRITGHLCTILKRHQPVYVNTHFNHPDEVTAEAAAACAMLADSGVPLGNQTVLLKNVNDEAEVLKTLFQRLLLIRVKPYYLHQMDLVRGTRHFRTSVGTGLSVMDALRGHASGLAVPYYMIDLPKGKGKVPLVPGPHEVRGTRIILKNYRGETVEYEDVDEDQA